MTQKRFLSGFVVGVCTLFAHHRAVCIDSLSQDDAFVNDLAEPSGYGINPSSLPPADATVALISVQTTNKASLEDLENGGATYSKTLESKLGIQASSRLADGISLGLFIVQSDASDHSSGDPTNLDDGTLETFRSQRAHFRTVLPITDKVKIGAMLRLNSITNTVVGTFSANSSQAANRTKYTSLLLGPGAGVTANFGPALVGLAYLNSMRASSKVRGEEKIISEPGIVQLSFVGVSNPWYFGLELRRFIYDRDDRGTGSSLNDAQLTPINLFGLNPDRSDLFLVDDEAIEVSRYWGKHSLGLRLAQDTFAFTSYQRSIPAMTTSSRLTYWTGNLELGIRADRIRVTLGAKMVQAKEHVERTYSDALVYKGNKRSYLLGLSSEL